MIDYRTVKPLNGKVVFEVEKAKKPTERTSGGIILMAKEVEETRNVGVVISVADDVEKVSVGDTIVVDKYNSLLLADETDTNLYVVDEGDIFGKC